MTVIYTEAQVQAMLADLRERCAEIATHIGFDLIADQITVEPLTTPDTPPGIGYGPAPTQEEAMVCPRWLGKSPEPRDLEVGLLFDGVARAAKSAEQFADYLDVTREGWVWLPLDSNGLPCERPEVKS